MGKIFPKQFDNDYRGHWGALVLLVIITIFKTIMAYNTTINTYYGAVSADGIPIDSYSPDAANMVLSIFAKLGNMHFILIAISVMALVRYRSMVPLIFLILIYEYLSRRVLGVIWDGIDFFQLPGSTAGWILQSLFAAMVVGFILSIWPRARPAA